MITRKVFKAFLILFAATSIQIASAQTPTITASMNNIFSLAESKLSQFFPPGEVTQISGNFVYRYYANTGIYLAFADDSVYLLGGAFGTAVVNVGSILSVESVLSAYEVPVDLWNLNISGTVTFFGQSTSFDDIAVEGIPAPDVTNLNEITQTLNETLAGVASDISSISIIVINNAADHRTVDVNFSATMNGIAASFALRLNYTK